MKQRSYTVHSWIDDYYCTASIIPSGRVRRVAIAEACCTGNMWIINHVFVVKKYRDSGYGRIVTKEVLCLLRDEGVKEVFVTPGGYPEYPKKLRVKFYENLGFEKVKSRTKKYIYGSYIKTFERE